jgi:hypothetical protein
MIQDIFALVISWLIVDPLQNEMNKRLAEVRAPQALIADVRTCAESSLPKLADRAAAEPSWVLATALDVWTGRTAPEDVLGASSPQCANTVVRAKDYLAGRGA